MDKDVSLNVEGTTNDETAWNKKQTYSSSSLTVSGG